MKKSLVVLSAAAMIAAAAVPALALENEFHGMFRSFGYLSNVYQGAQATSAGPALTLKDTNKTASYFEQRARLQYIAKASDDLKLVTHFELDSLFGGGKAAKYLTNDAGGLDADQVNLETKNVYLDFNIPAAPVNVKIGIQPYSDAYQGVFGNFDGTGILATGKFGMITPSLGWFRVGEDTVSAIVVPGQKSNDLVVLSAKAAVTKDITVGGNYYALTKDTNAFSATAPSARLVHTLGVDAAVKVGPAAISAFGAYQFGEYNDARDLAAAYALGAVAKVKLGPGNVNVSTVYLSGDKDASATTGGDYGGWQQLSPGGATSYFSASNMWLLVRNGATINTSTAIGTNDLTKGGRGFFGLFAGYEGTAGKIFYAANAGYGQVAEKRNKESATLGTEVNGTVGYKLYDNFSASFNAAYALLGKGMDATTGTAANGFRGLPGSAANAKDPYVTFVRLDYTF